MDVLGLLQLVYDNTWFRVVFGLLVVNVVTGIAAALHSGNFVLGGLADWLRTRAVPYIMVDGVMQAFFLVAINDDPVLGSVGLGSALGAAVHLFVMGSLAAHILSNLKDIGINAIPERLTNGRVPAVPDTSRTTGVVTDGS